VPVGPAALASVSPRDGPSGASGPRSLAVDPPASMAAGAPGTPPCPSARVRQVRPAGLPHTDLATHIGRLSLSGFEGDRCERDVDDCPGHLCQNGGRCLDGEATYACDCPAGWTGRYCHEDVDECAGPANPCLNGATCANSEGG